MFIKYLVVFISRNGAYIETEGFNNKTEMNSYIQEFKLDEPLGYYKIYKGCK